MLTKAIAKESAINVSPSSSAGTHFIGLISSNSAIKIYQREVLIRTITVVTLDAWFFLLLIHKKIITILDAY